MESDCEMSTSEAGSAAANAAEVTAVTETAVLAITGVSLLAPAKNVMGGCQIEVAARERAKIAMLKSRATSGMTKPA